MRKRKQNKPSLFLFIVGMVSALFMRERRDAWEKLMTSIAKSRANIIRNFKRGKK